MGGAMPPRFIQEALVSMQPIFIEAFGTRLFIEKVFGTQSTGSDGVLSDGIRYQKLNIKNQSCGVAASRQRLLNFALCILIFDLPGAMAW